MSRRVAFDEEDEDDEGDEEKLTDAQQEVRDFQNEKRRQKLEGRQSEKRKRDEGEEQGERGENEGNEEKDDDDEDGDNADLVFEERADGSRKVVGVFGEEKECYRKTDLAQLEMELGTKLEPFNLKAEMEVGHFDEKGHYIERGFDAKSDAWLDEVDEANKDVIGGAKGRFILRDAEDGDNDDEIPEKKVSVSELGAWAGQLRALMIDEQETVTGALKRLALAKREAHKLQKAAKIKPESEVEDAFDRASTLVEKLASAGHSVFGYRRRDLLQWRRGAKVFEYQIGGEGEIFGPFSGDTLQYWIQQGFFNGNNVQIRIKIGPNKGVFKPAAGYDVDYELGLFDL